MALYPSVPGEFHKFPAWRQGLSQPGFPPSINPTPRSSSPLSYEQTSHKVRQNRGPDRTPCQASGNPPHLPCSHTNEQVLGNDLGVIVCEQFFCFSIEVSRGLFSGGSSFDSKSLGLNEEVVSCEGITNVSWSSCPVSPGAGGSFQGLVLSSSSRIK